MVQVPVPIDVATVASTGSSAFTLATPLRVEELLVLAVCEALGIRAPLDKRERAVRAALDGLRAGKFVVNVDGRMYRRTDDVVLCERSATLRFFAAEPVKIG